VLVNYLRACIHISSIVVPFFIEIQIDLFVI